MTATAGQVVLKGGKAVSLTTALPARADSPMIRVASIPAEETTIWPPTALIANAVPISRPMTTDHEVPLASIAVRAWCDSTMTTRTEIDAM